MLEAGWGKELPRQALFHLISDLLSPCITSCSFEGLSAQLNPLCRDKAFLSLAAATVAFSASLRRRGAVVLGRDEVQLA